MGIKRQLRIKSRQGGLSYEEENNYDYRIYIINESIYVWRS